MRYPAIGWNVSIRRSRKVRSWAVPAVASVVMKRAIDPNGLILYATRNTLGVVAIASFACPDTEQLFRSGQNRRFANMAKVALRKLDMLNAAIILADLRVLPANRLKALSGRRSGQHSIRVDDQWRICFTWTPAGPAGVEIVDYH